ncbi:hypothetical protein WBG78_22670 [Chryseolinea sp. T2]|uniref:hypothetical protein n=1 Tax=Chryseolinea sp. T2 TaxID=3129255 RepID=UPI003076DA06
MKTETVSNILGWAVAILLLASCTRNDRPVAHPLYPSPVSTPHEALPREVAETIENEFPGAMPFNMAIDSLLQHLLRAGISPDQILWGQSTCVDDITNTKNKLIHPEIKGPFTFGGLGGLPFTGITGVSAFSHHVPEGGTALMLVGPHIGYKQDEGWGKILRHGQHHSSTCCGALYAALTKLKENALHESDSLSRDDYQEKIIERLAFRHKEEILTAKEPLVTLTRIVFHEAQQEMTKYAKAVHERHFAYAVVVSGVIINTDFQYDDYLWIEQVAIKDIERNEWIEGGM